MTRDASRSSSETRNRPLTVAARTRAWRGRALARLLLAVALGGASLTVCATARAQGQNIACNPNSPTATQDCLAALEAAFPGVADGPDCWGNHTCSAPDGHGGWYCNYQIQNRCYGSTYCCDPVNSTCTPYNANGCGQGCNAPFLNCHANNDYSWGCDTDPRTDANNCGACGRVCSSTNGTPGCANSSCTIACNPGYGNCDNNAANGCEVNTTNDVNNCGACGAQCYHTGGVTATACASSACQITACSAGYADCDHAWSNGCETWLGDVNNCGACGRVCAHQANETSTCTSGACGVACVAGYGNCDGNAANGCETLVNGSDVNNCGACGHVCPSGTGTQRAVCNAGACGFTTCPAGYETCGSGAACATNVATDVANCGGCGLSCSSANIARACSGGVCDGACAPGFADCNGNKLSDGCEVDLQSDANNCGACGAVCSPQHAVALCSSGSCGYSQCAAGYADCDGVASNGCETRGSCPDLSTPPVVHDLGVAPEHDLAVPVVGADDMSHAGGPAAATPDLGSGGAPDGGHHSGCAVAGPGTRGELMPLVLLLAAAIALRFRRRRL